MLVGLEYQTWPFWLRWENLWRRRIFYLLPFLPHSRLMLKTLCKRLSLHWSFHFAGYSWQWTVRWNMSMLAVLTLCIILTFAVAPLTFIFVTVSFQLLKLGCQWDHLARRHFEQNGGISDGSNFLAEKLWLVVVDQHGVVVSPYFLLWTCLLLESRDWQ